ncbi:P-loop containing nucleoside triphosphate hydrolase protein [Multifurca ochricompacta]|uniref:P-loop containing nucleoside triphosphate hydrolase protein n=1 Tax=Multifurca ochricompacta TaxID=376703 RepID=A0AAD4MAJ1_9AGAM|nr:P-loop containing nucleoside triphosphate hydrolase protein [Multifurca ochricompacta]
MPSFLTPLPTDGSHTQKRKIHELEQPEVSSSKKQSVGTALPESSTSRGGTRYWMVQWRAPQAKKHKTWEGDGILVVTRPKAVLMDLEGRILTTGNIGFDVLEEGVQLKLGNKELEIDRVMQPSEYLSGTCFIQVRGGALDTPLPPLTNSTALSRQFIPLKPVALNPSPVRLPTSPRGSVSPKKVIELEPVNLLSRPAAQSSKERLEGSGDAQLYWTANWRKPQHKKHKTWDGDAYITIQGAVLILVSEHGKILGRKAFENLHLTSGLKIFIGGLEIELDTCISQSEFPKITGTSQNTEDEQEEIQLMEKTPDAPLSASYAGKSSTPIRNLTSSGMRFIPPTTFYAKPASKSRPNSSLYDPKAEGAVVMKSPTEEQSNRFNKKSLPIVPVVIDPILARRLRPHQVEGVKFMYECVMGLRRHEGQGCILADEMGLGKTLQTITLIWTLLKQNPYAGAGPVVGKVLIVCPVSLVNNWKSEFHKWLGRDRIGVLTGDKGKTAIRLFTNSKIHQVLVIGYERLRTVVGDLVYCNPPIGLIIADEGHRLKSASNKTSSMFVVLKTPRRIILSGTPIQNDLGEFHAMVKKPHDYTTFRRVYEMPIIRSREPGCSAKEAELGESRSAQLLAISRSFVLRRDAGILKSFLPPKYEYVVFVTPTALQLSIFAKILNPDRLDNIIEYSTAESLALINILTKISNSPILLKAVADKAKEKIGQGLDNVERTTVVEEAVKLLPERARVEDVALSGKLTALANLLRAIKMHTDEKCIIVSHYTSTLNIVEAFCKKISYSYLRLDGSTPAAKRSEHVSVFNKSSQGRCFVFLLSSKAGGVGLNLIGASRLCLIDSDWNPSHDLQSMARIHRDGQKRSVYIYRFLTAGTIDEKIYQRQGKTDSKTDSFTHKELRDIFTIHPGTACHSHDLLDCPCDRIGMPEDGDAELIADTVLEDGRRGNVDTAPGFVVASQLKTARSQKMDRAYLKKKKAELAALGEWTHVNCLKPDAGERVHDDILRGLLHQSLSSPERVVSAGNSSKSRVSSLLGAVDLDNISRLGITTDLTVNDVPGGTVSFLFEKGTSILGGEGEDKDPLPS